MKFLFHEILYRPLFNALVFLYEHVTLGDLGIAIVLLTLLIRGALYPLFYKSLRQQSLMQRIQPHVKKIQIDHKDNKEKQATALLALYKEHKVNPFSGFFLILLQLPILIALYQVFLNEFSASSLVDLYTFFPAPDTINHVSLGLIDLTKRNILIVALAAIAQYFQGKISLAKQKQKGEEGAPGARMMRQMIFIGPVVTILILSSLPAAIGVYWLTTSLFSVFQQIAVERSFDKEKDKNDATPHERSISETT